MTPNVVRIVLWPGLKEIKFCIVLVFLKLSGTLELELGRHSPLSKWNLKSNKGYYSDVVVITGTVEPDPMNKLVPIRLVSYNYVPPKMVNRKITYHEKVN